MGRSKATARKRKQRPNAASALRGKGGKGKAELSVAELLEAAQEEMDNFQYEAAQRLCRTALAREPDNVAVLETSSSLCLEAGDLDGARRCLGRAITLQPAAGHEKYMSMAQLLEGQPALQCYQKGIEILDAMLASLPVQEQTKAAAAGQAEEMTLGEEGSRNGTAEGGGEGKTAPGEDKAGDNTVEEGNENLSPVGAGAVAEGSSTGPAPAPASPSSSGLHQAGRAGLARQASVAHCCVAELFMTDLCDVEEAEATCQASITRAIKADPTNPEAYQHMASFLLVKQEAAAAQQYMNKSLAAWLPQYRAVREGKAAAGTFDPVEPCPLPFAARLSTARILIELEDHKAAGEVLEGLLEEDDEVVDVWYLMGWSHYLQGEEQREAAQHSLHRALQIHSQSPCEDNQLVEHLQELVAELGPYTEKEEPDQNIEQELEEDSDSEEEEEEEDAMDTS